MKEDVCEKTGPEWRSKFHFFCTWRIKHQIAWRGLTQSLPGEARNCWILILPRIPFNKRNQTPGNEGPTTAPSIWLQNGSPRQIPSPAIIQAEHRQVNINQHASWCLHYPQNLEKGILPFNPLWQDRWHLQPNAAPGKCFSCYQLRRVPSTVSITCTWRTTGSFAKSVFHLIAPPCPLGRRATDSKGVAAEENESCMWAGNFLVHSGKPQQILLCF